LSSQLATAASNAIPSVYIIHDDRDRGLVELLARRLAAEGLDAWGRGQRRPGNKGAEFLIARAKVGILLVTSTTAQSQLVHVDLTRAARQHLPMARLIVSRDDEAYGADQANLGGVTAYEGLSENALQELIEIIGEKARANSLKSAFQRLFTPNASRAANNNGETATPDTAATLGRRMTLTRVLPLMFILACGAGAGVYWWSLQRTAQVQDIQNTRPRLAETPVLQSLTAPRFTSPTRDSDGELELPPGIVRAGYEAEPAPTALQIADGAAQLKISKINRGAFRQEAGARVCDLEVTVENISATPLPVVAFTIGLRDAARLQGDERTMKVERQWIGAGSVRTIKGKLSNLPSWASTISVVISQTKA
jgi:hypothetical protein